RVPECDVHPHSFIQRMTSTRRGLSGRPPLSLLPTPRIRRPLHSSPTRRSSDLVTTTPRCATRRSPSGASSVASASDPPTLEASRSEEHTSELQSLRHVVCRLLLEKKTGAHAVTPLRGGGGRAGVGIGACVSGSW